MSTMRTSTETDPRLLRLAKGDNVLVLATSVPKGTVLQVADMSIAADDDLTLGHKVAARDIAEGETVLKYAFPIGVAKRDIAAGEHVHLHNVASAYTPSYVVEAPE